MTEEKSYPPTDNPIRDITFGDLPWEDWAEVRSDGMPWILFRDALREQENGNEMGAIQILTQILGMEGLESRHYLQACFLLRSLGVEPNAGAAIYGVVVEIGMEKGFDLLAVYADHSARYYNFSGSAIVWDGFDAGIAEKIDQILTLGLGIVEQIGPSNGPRPDTPKNGMARINFLTPAGLHFGEAPQSFLFNDPMAGRIMRAMLNMMETLIEKVKP